MKKIFENNFLLTDFLRDVEAEILSLEEEKKNAALFEAMYPITDWGKVDWEMVKIKKEIHHLEEIIPCLNKILLTQIDYSVYILCDDAMIPTLKVNLKDIIEYFHKMERISMQKFIFNLTQGYIIEVLFSGKVTIGLVEKERIVLCFYLKDFIDVLPITRFHNKYNDDDMRWIRKLFNPFAQPKYWNINEPYRIESAIDIIPTIQALLKQSIEKDILLIWDDKQFPIIETNLEKIVSIWEKLSAIKIPFQIIAINSSYKIDVNAEGKIQIIVNFGLSNR